MKDFSRYDKFKTTCFEMSIMANVLKSIKISDDNDASAALAHIQDMLKGIADDLEILDEYFDTMTMEEMKEVGAEFKDVRKENK